MLWQPGRAMLRVMAGARSFYPLVVRNKAPLVQRGFILLWMAVVVAVTLTAWNAHPPDPTRTWPWILLLFWAVGLFAVRRAFSIEAAKLVVSAPRQALVERGPPLRRRRHALGDVTLTLVDTRDGGGDPYFHLRIDAPGGPAIIAEGHRRAALVALQDRIERALGGR
jgi:hypothetical protein